MRGCARLRVYQPTGLTLGVGVEPAKHEKVGKTTTYRLKLKLAVFVPVAKSLKTKGKG